MFGILTNKSFNKKQSDLAVSRFKNVNAKRACLQLSRFLRKCICYCIFAEHYVREAREKTVRYLLRLSEPWNKAVKAFVGKLLHY